MMSISQSFVENLFGLSGQVAVVIGSTGVLGGAIAEGIAQAGATTIVAGRGAERGQQRIASINKLGGKAHFLPVDITQRSSIEKLLAAVLQQCDRVDMLVNCAGVNSATDYLDATDDDWQRILQTNLTSTHWACQIFGAHMVKSGGGAILNIGSVSAGPPLSRVFAYSASKAAVVNLTKNVAHEFASHNVRVNVLCPGFFPAEQNRAILSKERVENIMRHTPMDRFGEPSELVGAALLLLSKQAGSFITGATLYVDGGFTAVTI
jgi:NAD(P)-dependent dehydrogenase (short-subunit alcohol dehydrogenase family)